MSAFVPPPPQRPWGHRLFFPAAALYGALSVPLWVAGYFGWLGIGWTPALHAHEMLMGYALAVVGGFLLTRPSGMALTVAFAAWLAGRLAVLAGLPPEIAAPLALAYPVALFVVAGVPFLRAAKSGHNKLFGPVIGAFALAEALVWWGGDGGRTGALFALHLVGILMLVMGGRIIPSATAGEVRRQGGTLVERVQPRLEWAGVAGAVLAALTVARRGDDRPAGLDRGGGRRAGRGDRLGTSGALADGRRAEAPGPVEPASGLRLARARLAVPGGGAAGSADRRGGLARHRGGCAGHAGRLHDGARNPAAGGSAAGFLPARHRRHRSGRAVRRAARRRGQHGAGPADACGGAGLDGGASSGVVGAVARAEADQGVTSAP
nr:NnrS family protein [Azospirillum baldaniorum]